MRLLTYSLIVCLMLLCNHGNSQPNLIEKFTLDDGLSSTELIDVMCDEEGYLWLSFNRGNMQRFDGRTFEHVPTAADDLSDRFAIMAEDENGIWYSGRDHVFKKEHGTFIPFKMQFPKFLRRPEGEILLKDKEDYVYEYNPEESKWERICINQELQSMGNIDYMTVSNSSYTILNKEDDQTHVYSSSQLCNGYSFKASYDGYVRIFWSSIYKIENGDLFEIQNNQLNKINFIDRDEKPISIPLEHGHERTINNTHLFKVVNYSSNQSLNEYVTIKKRSDGQYQIVANFSASGILHGHTFDFEENLWFATHDGLHKVSANIYSFNESRDDLIPALHTINEDINGNMWFGGFYTGFCQFNGNNMIFESNLNPKGYKLLPGSYRDGHGNMYFWDSDQGLMYQQNGKWQYQNYFHNPQITNRLTGYFFEPLNDNQIIAGLNKNGAVILTFESGKLQSEKLISELESGTIQNVLCTAIDKKGRIWQGHPSNNFRIYDPANDEVFVLNADIKEQPGLFAISMEMDSKDRLWIGAKDGLYLLEGPHAIDAESASDSHKIDNQYIYGKGSNIGYIKEYNDHLIFGSNSGIHAIALSEFDPTKSTHQVLTINTNKVSLGGAAEQNAVYIDTKGRLWAGHDHAAICISESSFPKARKPQNTIIAYIKAGDEFVSNIDSSLYYRLPPAKRNLEILLQTKFEGQFSNMPTFAYQIRHPDQDFSSVKHSNTGLINFEYIPPGLHEFRAWTISDNIPGPPCNFDVIVPLSLKESPYFWAALIGGIGIITIFIFWLLYSYRLRIKEQELAISLEQQEKDRLQVQAIANSLNPHFINNSLHFIQSRVRKDNESVKVINRLAENMKSIFKKSREGKAVHTLEEEMKLVQNYLIIQEARFGRPISFKITGEERFQKLVECNIPMLQLQILIENSIEHGLRNSDRPWQIELKLSEDDDYLHFTIIDNGIGRKAAKSYQSSGTQQGLKMLGTLHDIFNRHNDKKISKEYIDLPFTDHEGGYGTEAHVHIPKKITYEF